VIPSSDQTDEVFRHTQDTLLQADRD
jgi:hypothetical protein